MTTPALTLEAIADAIGQLPQTESVQKEEKRVCFSSSFGGIALTFAVEWRDGFSIPNVWLLNPPRPLLNHISWKGLICITYRQTFVIDLRLPEEVIKETVVRALGVVAEALADLEAKEILEEFEGYWSGMPGIQEIQCFVAPGSDAKAIHFYEDNRKEKSKSKQGMFLESSQRPSKHYGFLRRISTYSARKAIYVPLEQSVYPPAMHEPLTAAFLDRIKAAISPDNRERLQKIVGSFNHSKHYHLLFRQPRRDSRYALFGVTVQLPEKGQHPFAEGNAVSLLDITPLQLLRHDQQYLAERGGGSINLRERTVAVIGVGSVGSQAAEQLARSGVGKIVLVDPDIFSQDNLHRHVLGGSAIGRFKCEALADHVREALPYVEVEAHPMGITAVHQEGFWQGIDAAIVATGDATVERWLNREMRRLARPPLITYSWLEAYGIGGHALCTDNTSPGCLECCYVHDNNAPLRNRMAFLENGSEAVKSLTGCGNGFVPFSHVDAVMTAALATKLTIAALTTAQRNARSSWKGDSGYASAHGMTFTYRFNQFSNSLQADNEFAQSKCPVCGRHA